MGGTVLARPAAQHREPSIPLSLRGVGLADVISCHMHYRLILAVILATGGNTAAQRWQDATADCLGTTAEWSNRVDVGDVDGDGKVDLLIANGGNYDNPGTPEPVRIWKNLGGWATAGSHCTEISAQAVGGFTGLSRVIKAVDLDGDKDLDLITGGAYQTQLKLFTRNAGTWSDATAQLPQQLTSIGDVEAGDVDGDGDLDLLLAEWGALSPNAAGYVGGRTRLYLNNGQGTFTEATSTHMPTILMKWSWDVELADVDNDFDLDALVACKRCTTSYIFTNDGTGHFTDAPNALPHFANNYDFEPMDIDSDGDLDLITINDGPQIREHLLVNDGSGVFTDETATRLAGTANPANADDNAALWMDVDADGDADLLFATLGTDRLLLNTAGVFTLNAGGATPNDTPGSLGIAAADLDDDGRLDLLQGQGETAFADKVQLANAMFAVDTVAPSITVERKLGSTSVGVIRARVHDHVGPSHAHDWQRVWLEHDGIAAHVFESAPPPTAMVDMVWIGEFLWAAPSLDNVTSYRVCATDRRGNSACSDFVYVLGGGGGGTETGDTTDAPGGGGGSGGCCDAGRRPASSILLVLAAMIILARRRGRAATIKV